MARMKLSLLTAAAALLLTGVRAGDAAEDADLSKLLSAAGTDAGAVKGLEDFLAKGGALDRDEGE
jgi:hypothetical protein